MFGFNHGCGSRHDDVVFLSLGDFIEQCLEIDCDHSLLHLGSWIVIVLSCTLALSKCCSWYSITFSLSIIDCWNTVASYFELSLALNAFNVMVLGTWNEYLFHTKSYVHCWILLCLGWQWFRKRPEFLNCIWWIAITMCKWSECLCTLHLWTAYSLSVMTLVSLTSSQTNNWTQLLAKWWVCTQFME